MSTSWYSPPATSDDWLITPQISLTSNNELTFEEKAQDPLYPDGYELRISTTTPTIAGFLANPPLLSVLSASGGLCNTQTVDLDALGYFNQNIYLAWRNNSNNQFILMIDDIVINELIAFDVSITDTSANEYTMVPLPQVTTQGIDGLLTNIGTDTVTNASMTINVYDGTQTVVYSGMSNVITSLAPGASSSVTNVGFTPVLPDIYTIELISNITEQDGDMSNDTLVYTYEVTDDVYARDNGISTGSLGIGNGTGGELGQTFEIINTDEITSVSVFLTNAGQGMNGRPLWATVYETDANGTPTNELITTDTVIIDTTENIFWTLPIAGGYFSLIPGDYVVVANEIDSNLTIGTTSEIFTLGKTWVSFVSNPWQNNEAFNFNVTYLLRANFACLPTADTITELVCGGTYSSPSGNFVWTSSGVYQDTIINAEGCDSIITINLTIGNPTQTNLNVTSCDSYTSPSGNNIYTVSGIYNDTLSTIDGCDSVLTIDLTVGSPTQTNLNVTSCDSYISPSGNNSWTVSGVYNDTLLTVNGCDSVLIINLTIDVVDLNISETNGEITASQMNAAYQWIDCGANNSPIVGETGQSFTPSANGDYAVVITNGVCVDTSLCLTINTIGIEEEFLLQGIDIIPNPSNGIFSIVLDKHLAGNLEIIVTDLNGRLILTTTEALQEGETNISINLKNAESGVYLVKLVSDKKYRTERILITKN
ncbi:MAG: choice-of-anchor J domain-containing protein [Crocinitomicaceae bacterium]